MAHGRHASAPTRVPLRGWWDIALRVKDRITEDRVGLIAAGVAFFGLLALFPAITALLAIGGLVTEPSQIVAQMEEWSQILPDAATEIIMGQATEVAGSQGGGLGLAALIGIGLALYSASKGVGSLIQGLNVAYGETEKRGFVQKFLVTLGLTVLLIIGLLIGLLSTIAIPIILDMLSFGPVAERAGSIVVALVLFGMTVVALSVVYRFGPSRRSARFQWVSPGALLACVVWMIASIGFAAYVSNFASYNESFGALAGVVILLMWLWISAYVILLGAEVNAEAEAQTRYDTTIGDYRPMGQRGAVKADTLGKTRA